jgi:3D (Asp-Asp-Asp) domain-containing protein
MKSHPLRLIALLLLVSLLVGADEHAAKRKVCITHYGYPGDPNAARLTRLGLGDHNKILNQDSVAVSPDLDAIFPFGSAVSIDGRFLGYRTDTTNRKWRNAITIYDPKGEFKEDFEATIDFQRRKNDLTNRWSRPRTALLSGFT